MNKITRSRVKPETKRNDPGERDLVLIQEWCAKRGIKVILRSSIPGQYLFESKTIEVSHRFSLEKQICIILHECGHFLTMRSRKKGSGHFGNKDIDICYPSTRQTKTTCYKIDVIDEELEAWRRGWALAERLCLNISKKKFTSVRTGMLKRYVCWAVSTMGKADEP